jgi:transposase
MLYLKIRQLHERKFKIAQIADELKISRPTVYKYLEMTFEEAQEYLGNPHRKPKKLDPYRDFECSTDSRLVIRALSRFEYRRKYRSFICK